MTRPRTRRPVVAVAATALLAGALAGCSSASLSGAPTCRQVARLALVAQAVPTSAYVPCLRRLPAGWSVDGFDAHDGGATFVLVSDRAPGHPVEVRLRRRCDVTGASPQPPRTLGGRTYLRLAAISPRYRGTLVDVFPGGCVTYDVDFARGPHIGLVQDVTDAVGLVPRRQLRLELRHLLGTELDP